MIVTKRVSVVLANGRAHVLRLPEGVDALYRIGDCEAPRLIADAVFSGHRLAREIDSPNPHVHIPTVRERVVPA